MSQAALGKAVGVDQSTISDIESGKGFGVDKLDAMAATLMVSVEWIVRGEQEEDDAKLLGAYYAMNESGRASLTAVAAGLALTHRRPSGKRRAGG